MGRSQDSFSKREIQKRKEKKRKDKEKKRQERTESGKSSLDDMIAYVDEFGRISDTPPDENQKKTTPKASEIEVSVPRTEGERGPKTSEGKLNFYNDSKGYGFITEMGTGQSIFVHVNDFQDDIREGDRVSFDIGKGRNGPAAMNVKLLK